MTCPICLGARWVCERHDGGQDLLRYMCPGSDVLESDAVARAWAWAEMNFPPKLRQLCAPPKWICFACQRLRYRRVLTGFRVIAGPLGSCVQSRLPAATILHNAVRLCSEVSIGAKSTRMGRGEWFVSFVIP